MELARVVYEAIDQPLDIAVVAHDGSKAGPKGAPTTLRLRSPDALRRVLHHPGELGLVRAFVAGDVDIDGDIYALLSMGLGVDRSQPAFHLSPELALDIARTTGLGALRPIRPPVEEARLHGRLHSRRRDAAAISHHYDVSNDFYRIVLGPAMTYSCAVFRDPDEDLASAQTNKHDLVCRKLGLEADMRLLDVGCGWGSMLIHAASTYGVRGVGITISRRQAELAEKRVAEAGLRDLVEIRLQDYRDIDDGPFDAISSVGMLEHVGRAHMPDYDHHLFELVRPGGRVLNHGICRPAISRDETRRGDVKRHAARVANAVGSSHYTRIRSPLMERYVFPDGELHEVGAVVSMMAEEGFEVRHVENLREHYALTLRAWVRNLESQWDDAAAAVGEGRARVWRLYMAACALGFQHRLTEIHQVLAVRLDDTGRSGVPLRPRFNDRRLPERPKKR
jgi:cyclopropane-fatty-acyl-phospholipid synthase